MRHVASLGLLMSENLEHGPQLTRSDQQCRGSSAPLDLTDDAAVLVAQAGKPYPLSAVCRIQRTGSTTPFETNAPAPEWGIRPNDEH